MILPNSYFHMNAPNINFQFGYSLWFR